MVYIEARKRDVQDGLPCGLAAAAAAAADDFPALQSPTAIIVV